MNTRWLTNEIVEGEPITIGDKTLIPLARKLTLRFDWLGAQGGGGGGIEHVQPIGVIEKIGEVSRRVPIEDVTGAALRSILIGAVLIGGLSWLARVFVARRRKT